jgi:predicted esterase
VVEDAMAAQDDAGRAALLSDIIAWAMGSLGLPASSQVFLAGHSKGAKLSALAAAGDERVKGLVLIDPVDATYEQIEGCVHLCSAMLLHAVYALDGIVSHGDHAPVIPTPCCVAHVHTASDADALSAHAVLASKLPAATSHVTMGLSVAACRSLAWTML